MSYADPTPARARLRAWLLGAALLASLGGCIFTNKRMAELSSQSTGCPAPEIAIRDLRLGDPALWTATCRGRDYHCRSEGSRNEGSRVTCKEALSPAASTSSAPASSAPPAPSGVPSPAVSGARSN